MFRLLAILLCASSALAQLPWQAASDNAVLRSGSTVPAWKPTDLGSALVAAYDPTDASTVTQSSGAVSQLNDISGNGNHFVQAAGANKPTYSATGFMGKPGLLLDGSTSYMTVSSFTPGASAFAALAFMQHDYSSATTAGNQRFLSFAGSGQAGDYTGASSVGFLLNNGGGNTNISGYRGGVKSAFLATGGGIEPSAGGYYRMGSVWDGTNNTLYADNIVQTAVAATDSLATPGQLRLGALAGGSASNFWKGAVSRMLFMNRVPTTAELQKIDEWFRAPWTRFIGIEGDSLAIFQGGGGGAAPTGYTYVGMSSFTTPALVRNRAIGGSHLNDTDNLNTNGVCASLMRLNRPAWTDAMLPADKKGVPYTLYVGIGTNGLSGTDAAHGAADIATYAAARKAAGWDKVVIATILSRTDGTNTSDAVRNAYNAIVTNASWSGRTANGGAVDAVCDLAADAIMGVDAAPTVNSSYFADGVHPNATGNARLAPIFAAAINGL